MQYRPQFFKLYELVCPDVYSKLGEMAWQLLDEKATVTVDWIRRTLDKEITINNWHDGGDFSQRGLRCIQCQIVKDACLHGDVYVSAHILGRAFDFDVKGMTADDVRVWLALNKEKLPYPIRLERDTVWCHLDTEQVGDIKVYLFNA